MVPPNRTDHLVVAAMPGRSVTGGRRPDPEGKTKEQSSSSPGTMGYDNLPALKSARTPRSQSDATGPSQTSWGNGKRPKEPRHTGTDAA